MGVVYRASDASLDRPVALKLVAPELAADEDFRKRFRREAQLAAAIDHPNVVPVYEAGEFEGQLFLAMRLVEGIDLKTLIRNEQGLEPARAARIADQVATALEAAHTRGLVHRDVKPANVLIAEPGPGEHVYLTDFGLTKRTSSGTSLTRTGQMVGTIDYISPEQIERKKADARSDIYSLGCLLYHTLVGHVPFESDSDVAKMFAHLNEAPPAASAEVPGVPEGLDDVTAKAMAKRPEDRFQSAGEFREALSAAAPGSTEAASTVAKHRPARTRTHRSWHPRLRKAPATISIALGVVVGAAVAGLIFLAGGDDGNGGGRLALQSGADSELAAYQRDVGSICGAVNGENAAIPGRYRRLKGRVEGADSVTVRRALLAELNVQLRHNDDLLARLTATEPPKAPMRRRQAELLVVWKRSVERLRTERDGLERAASPEAVYRVATSVQRGRAERDRVAVRAGLIELGDEHCQLDPISDRPRVELDRADVVPATPDIAPPATEVPSVAVEPQSPDVAPAPDVTPPPAPATPPPDVTPPPVTSPPPEN